MTESAIQFEDLHRAYREWAGEPYSVSTFRREDDPAAFAVLDVLCYRSADEDSLRPEDEFTFLATVGLSLKQMPDATPRAELVWRVAGRRTWEEIQALSESLATIAVLPLYRPAFFAPGAVIRGVSFPVFDRMDSLLVTHWGVHSPEYLPSIWPPVLLLWIKALYGSEASIVEQIGDRETCRRFQQESIDWDDPARSPASLKTEEQEMNSMATSYAETILHIWAEIEKWYEDNVPRLKHELLPGASPEEITDCEAQIEQPLPDDLKTSLMVHNGEVNFHDYAYLGTESVARKWAMMTTLSRDGQFRERHIDSDFEGALQNVWWHPGYIPFASDSGGNLICTDMAPGPNGRKGQIVKMEMAAGPYLEDSSSFADWLARYRDAISSGKYRVNADGQLEEA